MIGEEAIYRFAQLNAETMAMNDAALADDLDEARFRARVIPVFVEEIGLAGDMVLLLRKPDTEPLPGYGHAMLRLANVLTASDSGRACNRS